MEISRREHGRPFHESAGPSRRNPRFASSSEPPPVNYNPWNKRYSPIDPDYQSDLPHPHRPAAAAAYRAAPHPYHRSQPRPRPAASSNSNKIPSLLSMELTPQPLFAPEDVERLRASLRKLPRRLQEPEYDEYDDSPPPTTMMMMMDDEEEEEYYSPPPPQPDEQHLEEYYSDEQQLLTEDEYLREEQKTKQQIEEIIAVAQALREKLDREEELRRQAELQQQQSIPKLMDLKPKIPSLLEIYVPPPPEMPDEDRCWNCRRAGHYFNQCDAPRQRMFCYRCGATGYDATSCPYCHTS